MPAGSIVAKHSAKSEDHVAAVDSEIAVPPGAHRQASKIFATRGRSLRRGRSFLQSDGLPREMARFMPKPVSHAASVAADTRERSICHVRLRHHRADIGALVCE